MDTKAVIRIVGTLLIYAVFALITQLFQSVWIVQITQGRLIPIVTSNLRDDLLIVVTIAFICSLIWFIAGEWAIQAWAPARTWYLTWILLFIVVAAGAVYYWFKPLGIVISDPDSYNTLGTYLAMGILPFYLCSVLFTPTNGKYVIFPSKYVVRW